MSDELTVPKMPPQRVRPQLVSAVALGLEGNARPIHIFRVGTYTGMSGESFTYAPEHIQSMVVNFSATRRRPPITERHDWGRAVGRITRLWTDATGENLYAQPAWNTTGKQLLSEEVYDGFSCEIEHDGDSRILIGGSLTNYPAVNGLDPVTLEAPDIDAPTAGRGSAVAPEPIAAGGLRADTSTHQQEQAMSDITPEQVDTPAPEPSALPPLTPPQIAASDPAVQTQINAVVAQMTAQFEAQRQIVLEQAQAQFQRQLAEMQARQQIETYAQHVTTATIQRQYALPVEASVITTLLSGLNADQRTQARNIFDRILSAGLVSFEELGSQGEDAEEQSAKERFDAAVTAKTAAGMTRYAAMQAVQKDQPDLYAAYQAESSKRGQVAAPAKKGGR